jgi:hypothetical protein
MLVCLIPAYNTRNEDDLKVIGGNTPNQFRMDGAYFSLRYDSLGQLEFINYKILYEDFTSYSNFVHWRFARQTYSSYYSNEHNAFKSAVTLDDSINVYIYKIIPESFIIKNEALVHWWGSWNVIGDTLEIKFIEPREQCISDVLHLRFLINSDTTFVKVDSFFSSESPIHDKSTNDAFHFRGDFPKPDSANYEWKYWKNKK